MGSEDGGAGQVGIRVSLVLEEYRVGSDKEHLTTPFEVLGGDTHQVKRSNGGMYWMLLQYFNRMSQYGVYAIIGLGCISVLKSKLY